MDFDYRKDDALKMFVMIHVGLSHSDSSTVSLLADKQSQLQTDTTEIIPPSLTASLVRRDHSRP